MMRKQIWGFVLAAGLSSLMLAGCGETAESSEQTEPQTTSLTEATTTKAVQTTTTSAAVQTEQTETTTVTEATLPPMSEDDISAQVQKSYRTGYDQGYADGLADGEKRSIASQNAQKQTVWVSGDFTATVRRIIPDYVSDTKNRAAVVTLFQDDPFVLKLDDQLCAQLKEEETYTFIVDAQEAEIYSGMFLDETTVSPDALMLRSFRISSVREPAEEEIGLNCWRVHYST